MNYVDNTVSGVRGGGEKLTEKCKNWLEENIYPIAASHNAKLRYIGTGALTNDKLVLV